MPSVFSAIQRAGLKPMTKFRIGAKGDPSRPHSSFRPKNQLRRLIPCVSTLAALAWVLISITRTPCGQTSVQMPQPEQ